MEEPNGLQQHIARVLALRSAAITRDAVAVFPYAGGGPADEPCGRLAELIVQLLIVAVGEADVDPRGGHITDLRRLARDQALSVRQLFDLVYLLERSALSELALDESLGVTSDGWPSITQRVRRAAVELLASFAERSVQEAANEALVDPLTTLHTRAVLLAALEKELQRAERFGHPFALIVFDVDRLGDINAKHGCGFGDRVLERLGIVIRKYFREQDWVSRSSGDRFAVLLPETPREHASQLAEHVRQTVQERMSLRDYRTDEYVPVTMSAAVVIGEAVDSSVRADSVLEEADRAADRARQAGRVEVMELTLKLTN